MKSLTIAIIILALLVSGALLPARAQDTSDSGSKLTVPWDEFKKLTPEDFKKNMKVPNLIDGRRIYDYDIFNNALNFRAMGRVDLN